jgi:hypothetical protein
MAMILSEHLAGAMSEWPRQWEPTGPREGERILRYLKGLWDIVVKEYPVEEYRQENCLRTLWILGYELSRDPLLDPKLREVPLARRAQMIIEEEGPLLFAFYSRSDETRFATGCRDIELALRRRSEWETFANPMPGGPAQ